MAENTDKDEAKQIQEIEDRYRTYKYARLTPLTREKFLRKIIETANVSKAAALIGVNRIRAYQIKKEDKEFSDLWDEAMEIATDYLEEEARRRAMHGTRKPVFYQGKICGYMQEYSDKLMEILLRGHRGQRYDRNLTELPPGSEIVIAIKTPEGAESKAIDITPPQIEEEEALTE